MKALLEEARTKIPNFDAIWDSVKQAIWGNIRKNRPSMTNGFRRWQLPINNIRVPQVAFYNSMKLFLDLYVAPENTNYQDFSDSELNPQMSISDNGKVDNISIRIQVTSSMDNIFKDILPEFYHEITHAFDYYNRLRGGQKQQDLQGKSTYSVTSLRKIMGNPNLSPLEKNLAFLFYYIDEDEYNARLSTFYGEIQNKDVSKGNINEIIQQTRVWKYVTFLYNVVYYMEQVTNPQDQRKLITIGNIMNDRVNKTTYSNYKTLLQDVTQKYNKLKTDTYNDFVEIVQEYMNDNK